MAEERFPLRIVIREPSRGFREHSPTITNWLDQNCGIDGWLIARADRRGDHNAIAVHVSNPTCALAFLARWCLPGDPSGLYELRHTDP